MFGSVLSVLLMGMLPVASAPSPDQIALQNVAISAPLPVTGTATTLLTLKRPLSASGALIVDMQSGQTLFAREAQTRRAMGSLTKLMTALLTVERHDLREVVTIPAGVKTVKGNVIHLVPGEKYTVGDLLTALLVASANDAAYTLAVYDRGSDEAFVAAMNDRAQALGLKNTAYASPDGMDEPSQWSTPQDLAWLASFVLGNPEIRSRMSSPTATIQALGSRTIALTHTHELLREHGAVIAGKTGTTEEAGQCLLSLVREGKREYLVIILGSRARYADMRMLLSALSSLFA